jgi:hypothetical protein
MLDETKDDIEVCRLTFKVIGEYNAALTQIAEGRSIDDVKGSTTGLLKSIDQLYTTIQGAGIVGLSSAMDIVSVFAEQMEKARLREEFVEAVTKGAPVVEAMINVMIDHIELHYSLRVTILNRERLRTVEAMRTAQETISEIIAERNVSASDVNDVEAEVNRRLATIQTVIEEYPIWLTSAGAKGAVYSPVDDAQVRSELKELGRLSDQYERNIQAVSALTGMLQEYRRMLANTEGAIRALVRSLSAPADLTVDANEMLEAAFRIKRDVEDFRAARALP